MDGIDYAAQLKKLDELDAKDYTPRHSISSNILKNMAATQDSTADSNVSDFDNSDEDLASLLNDDDDDEFAKKMFGNTAIKASSSKVSSAAATKSKVHMKITSPHHSPTKETKSHKSKITPNDEFGDDILDEFLEANVSKTGATDFRQSASEKNKVQRSSFQAEDDFSDQFSPSKDLSKSPTNKSISDNKNSNILDDFNTKKGNSKAPEERRGSFFDDFLQKLSPKHGSKVAATSDISEEALKDNDDSEEDILSAYIPTAPKKNDNSSETILKSPKRRGSLLKQVSFKDPSDDFYETDLPVTKAIVSPEKSSINQILPESPKNESPIRVRRSEKANSNKNDDIDWLNFFKDSPKKISKSQDEKKKSSENLKKTDLNVKSKSKPSMTRQSSADWLGLSDSKSVDEIDGNKDELTQNIKTTDIDKTNFMSTKPKTTSAPVIRPRRQEINKTIDEWNDESGFIKNSQPATTDLSHVLQDTGIKLPDKKIKPATSVLNDSFQPEDIDSFPTSKSKKDFKVTSKDRMVGDSALSSNFISDIIVTQNDYVMKEKYDVIPPRNLLESRDYVATLQSMKLMLDDSINEKNKLLKENESVKSILEEKIRTSEELFKSEKKMLEDSAKTLESSLKKEFDIKIKSLEERLNLITEEKGKQAKNFDEKINNILGEHQLEMQRLKELHNESINIMKKDHEDALYRLKRLKEQEIEAVLSTQVHSKSLQHLTDQLETRANELASLQNKIEGRSQSVMREKELLLDAKEKDLKALQNRLQKQLEGSDDERTRLQQLVLRLEGRLHKLTMEGEENHWETQQLKAKLTVKEKYLEEEQRLNQYQLEKEREKLKISQDSLLHEQKTVLLQLAQERQQLTQEKIDLQSLAKSIKEDEVKLNVRKLKEKSSIETEKQFLFEEKNKIHFEKEKTKQEIYQFERDCDSFLKEKQQIKRERENLHEQEMKLNRKLLEIEEMADMAAQEKEKGQREHAEALNIKKEHQLKMQQYTQQIQMLMDKERYILSEKEKLVTEKLEFEQSKNSVLCTKCKLSLENPFQVSPPPNSNIPAVIPLGNRNGFSSQVQQSFVDPNLVIWHITAQKDQEYLQQELAFLKSLKDVGKKKDNK